MQSNERNLIGIEEPETARLHLSEAPFAMQEALLQCAIEELSKGHLYPEAFSVQAVQEVADFHQVTSENVIVTNGADEAMLLAVLGFARNRQVVTSNCTYLGYRHAALVAGAQIKEAPLQNWCVDFERMLGMLETEGGVAVLCNPHNPTGTFVNSENVLRFVKGCHEKSVIPIIDEAYIAFSGQKIDTIQTLKETGLDFVCLRTLSKSHGLAGIRVGYAVGSRMVISKMRTFLRSLPFSVNRIAQRLLLEVVRKQEVFEPQITDVCTRREIFKGFLKTKKIWHTDSKSNFVFMDRSQFRREQNPADQGLLVRDCTPLSLPDYWRVSIGSPSEMERFAKWIDGNIQ